jgi:hypothetical protein
MSRPSRPAMLAVRQPPGAPRGPLAGGGATPGGAGYPGKFASIALSTSGSSGVVIGRNRAATLPSGRTRNFSKFH